jgi:catechol 2,3-dioxygenase-like lactoylglutathione lyase family enzyme
MKIALITILTDDTDRMLGFYRDILGFRVSSQSGDYAELENEGVRFAICARKIMSDLTNHPSFQEKQKGQAFELAFPLPAKADVDSTYYKIIEKGATAVKEPSDMAWGQRTAFFADPDGNIHEIYAD